MTTISIVIPTYNEEGYIGRLLKSIAKQTLQPYEVIIVDSHSRDHTFKDIAKYIGRVPIIGIGAPRGIGKARNIGAEKATGDILLFLDADVELAPNFLREALQEFTERKLDLAGAYFDVHPTLPTFDRFGAKVLNAYYASFQYSKNPIGNGFCILAKKSWHKRLKGFNEDYRHSEDHDYVKRAVEHGAGFRLLKSARFRLSNRRYVHDGHFTVLSLYTKAELNRIFFKYKYAPRERALYNFGIFTRSRTKSRG